MVSIENVKKINSSENVWVNHAEFEESPARDAYEPLIKNKKRDPVPQDYFNRVHLGLYIASTFEKNVYLPIIRMICQRLKLSIGHIPWILGGCLHQNGAVLHLIVHLFLSVGRIKVGEIT
jgi:hypothetical protein